MFYQFYANRGFFLYYFKSIFEGKEDGLLKRKGKQENQKIRRSVYFVGRILTKNKNEKQLLRGLFPIYFYGSFYVYVK